MYNSIDLENLLVLNLGPADLTFLWDLPGELSNHEFLLRIVILFTP